MSRADRARTVQMIAPEPYFLRLRRARLRRLREAVAAANRRATWLRDAAGTLSHIERARSLTPVESRWATELRLETERLLEEMRVMRRELEAVRPRYGARAARAAAA